MARLPHSDQYSPERFVARYEPLRPLLPKEEVTGFVLDERHAETKRLHPGARLFLAQYAVSPRRLTQDAASRWVVVDSDRPAVVPDVAAKGHWTLLADLRNGVRLVPHGPERIAPWPGLPRACCFLGWRPTYW